MKKLDLSAKVATEEARKSFIHLFPSLSENMDNLWKIAKQNGFITTLLGTRISLDIIDDKSIWDALLYQNANELVINFSIK